MTTACLAAAAFSPSAFARDTIESYSVDEALHSEPGIVEDDVALYFAGQPHPAVANSLGEAATNRKTNALGKGDEPACQHVFLSAVRALQDRARRDGGNAVIDIRSNYRGDETSSPTTFVCGAGVFVAGVALKGEVVTLRR
ncbi:excinuclease ABC subunit A [Burkholderia sp. WAC0059]|nr:excinuclease ABC subunit A [Burkholderia sp. WAC0059]